MTEASPAPLPEAAEKAKPQKSETKDFLQFVVKLALFVFVLRSFIFAPFNIPSESMLPRLLIGDYLLVSKWSYGYSKHSLPFSIPLIPGRILASVPDRGDVVVFKWPGDNRKDYIKRVIGLPGDLIEMKEGQLVINGKAVPKQRIADFVEPLSPYSACAGRVNAQFQKPTADGGVACHYPRFRETLPEGKSYEVLDLENHIADNTGVYAVPEGHLFVMGDNRDRSADSRFSHAQEGVEMVPMENLVGKAWFSVFSTDGSSSWLLPWTWFTAARWDRIGGGF